MSIVVCAVYVCMGSKGDGVDVHALIPRADHAFPLLLPPQAWIVFAPPPSASPTLSSALHLLRCLSAAPPSATPVLFLPDWSAFSLNCLAGGKTPAEDRKAVAAAHDVLLAGLAAIAPEQMSKVKVMRQSEVRAAARAWLFGCAVG